MEMSGTDKEIRPQSNSSLTFSHHHHHLLRESSSESMDHGSDPDRFGGSGASVTPISVGSRLLKPPPARYRECLKNHAANTGGNVTDGCGEFMPSGEDGTLEALKCAACNCHRNFHRKELTAVYQLPPPSPLFNRHPNWASSINAQPLKMTTATESSSEELNFTKKRFRSKFTQEQKEKMVEFAEKVGWRIPREDDPEVQRFCAVVGVKRQVLKVWMHNNKAINSAAKKQQQQLQDSID